MELDFGMGGTNYRTAWHMGAEYSVTNWVRLKFAAMNLKKLATWAWNGPSFSCLFRLFALFVFKSAAVAF